MKCNKYTLKAPNFNLLSCFKMANYSLYYLFGMELID
jgi:hypothetical protein